MRTSGFIVERPRGGNHRAEAPAFRTPPEPPELPFKLNVTSRGRFRHALLSLLRPAAERFFAFPELNAIYSTVYRLDDNRHFVDKVLSVMNITYEISDREIARIPRQGPAIVVANHPYGAIEGIVLAAVLRAVRPDSRIMANYLLSRIPELRDTMIFVDPFGSKAAVTANLRAVRQSIQWVNDGGLLAIFPAGEVAHLHLASRAVTDPPWSQTVARIVRKTEAPVVPVFFSGSNGPLFQLLGMIHPRLRTAMLPHELLNKKRTIVPLRVGTPIPQVKLRSFDRDQDLIAYLRLRTFILKNRREKTDARGGKSSFTIRARAAADQPIAAPQSPAALAAEVAALPPENHLVASGPLHVYLARAPQIPAVLREIGRLREITFRQVHEGTGKPADLDRFDAFYYQLFVWNAEESELVGAYRLGATDEILERYGMEGLYTSTLFNYQHRLLEQISPALELGRSWVRPEYQRSYAPLMLLWKGIGQFVQERPRYRMLFGPVSINNQYQSLSRQLIVTFLRANNYLPRLGRLLRAKNPPRVQPIKAAELRGSSTVVRDMDEVSSLISEVESDQKGIPILLKQYLKLDAKLLGFNIDPDFGDVLDGLMLVDLTRTDRRILEKYLGKEPAARFLDYHHGALVPA